MSDTNLAALSISLDYDFGGATNLERYLQIKILFSLISFNHNLTYLLVFKLSNQSLAFCNSNGFSSGPTINFLSVLYAIKVSITGYVKRSIFNNDGISLLNYPA